MQEQFYNPYGFVPVSNYVFNYTEKEKNSFMFANDVPFSNGISGRLFVTFKAETPFCIKSQNKQNCSIDNKFFVPSTSIKGMVRSVFDIMALSNIRNLSENSRFSMRDLSTKENYELKNDPPKSGFLILLRGNYYIIPCENWKVSYKDIEQEEGIDISREKSVEKKYRMLKKGYIFQTEDDIYHYWFFSGFMNTKRNEYDFAIPETISQEILIPLKKKELEDFLFIHERENKNKSWAFWQKEMRNFSSLESLKKVAYKGLAPCFYREQIDENKNKIVKDLGFSFLYRLPYQKRVHDCIPDMHKQESFDMSQALFGYVNTRAEKEQEACLRGRVRFSNAFIRNAKQEEQQTFILGSPHPTFYPFYLQQKENKQITFASNSPMISGWKRYLVHDKAQKGRRMDKGSESSFISLGAGASFTTEIHIHNLLPYEVGGLLAALTFCNHKECYHSLGYAKPFGYGKMKLVDLKLDLISNSKEYTCLDTVSLLTEFYKKVYSNTHISVNEYDNYLCSLFRIASGNYRDKIIRYPHLDNYNPATRRKENEFKIIKGKNKSIKDFTPIK